MGRPETPDLGGATCRPRPAPLRTRAQAHLPTAQSGPTVGPREPLGGGWAGQRSPLGGPAPAWVRG